MNASSACRAQRDPVDEEQDAGDDARIEQPLDESRRRARLAGAGSHLDQQLAPSAQDFGGQRLDAFDLVVAVDDLPVDGNRRQITPVPARGDPPFKVVLRKEARDLARVGVGFAIEKPHFLAVRQEDERHAELFGVVLPLVLGCDGMGARPLGFQRRHRPTLAVA